MNNKKNKKQKEIETTKEKRSKYPLPHYLLFKDHNVRYCYALNASQSERERERERTKER